ncbi:MAG TPA: hypothetical protein DGK91_08755 [Clostridium sp.]|jgi:hypothetical protein|nr:hypothetical protein [Clostridia bacterium]HCW04597.1 hypothetical protein [Clostridium sp.]
MAGNNTLFPHETLELKDLLSSDLIIAKKLEQKISMVQDGELKAYIERCLSTKKDSIKAIQAFSGAGESSNQQGS